MISSLRLGGAERNAAFMADYWAAKGFNVTLVTFIECAEHYTVGPDVRRIFATVPSSGANPAKRIGQAFRRQAVLRSAILASQPEVVISFLDMTNIRTLMALFGSGVPVVAAERNDPHHEMLPLLWQFLRRALYPTACCVVTQTARALQYFGAGVRARACVIPNPVWLPPGGRVNPPEAEAKRRDYQVIAVGRLVRQKGFDLLIEAFAEVARNHPIWHLQVWGAGVEREALEATVRRAGLEKRVTFPGATKDIHAILRKADLFVLSSRYEGFPNALCEAMACGLPVISFACPCGPSEIVRDGIDGLLVPPADVAALADAMGRLMDDEDLRRRLAARAPEILERFRLEKIMGMWEQLLRKVSLKKGLS